jgi:hypothetical protein
MTVDNYNSGVGVFIYIVRKKRNIIIDIQIKQIEKIILNRLRYHGSQFQV